MDELRAAFSAAKEAAPSILLLEDLNLYVESNSPYAPEWACLQACIDDAKSTDLFVIATTNDTKYMPPSLLRPGRFDYTLYLDPPTGKTAEKIVSYYLREKSVAKKLVNAYEEKGVTDQYRKAINEYWAQTETAFDQAAEQLDQAWTAYVERLQTTVDSYDIEQIETSLTAAKGIQNFFEHIPL